MTKYYCDICGNELKESLLTSKFWNTEKPNLRVDKKDIKLWFRIESPQHICNTCVRKALALI